MKVSYRVVIVASFIISTFAVQAQDNWELESVFIRNKLPSIRNLGDFIPLRANDISAFHTFLRFKEPSFQTEMKGAQYSYTIDPYDLMQLEHIVGARWMKYDAYQKRFLGASQLEVWLTYRPYTNHRINIFHQIIYTRSIGDTVENYLYTAKLNRKQAGIGVAYSKELFSRKRWQIYSGIQLGYQMEFGRGRLQESISDAMVTAYDRDSSRVIHSGINNRTQTISVAVAPTHVIIGGFQVGLDFKLTKRFQLFGLIQSQMLAVKNADSQGRFARGFALPKSIGIRYLLKPEKARVLG